MSTQRVKSFEDRALAALARYSAIISECETLLGPAPGPRPGPAGPPPGPAPIPPPTGSCSGSGSGSGRSEDEALSTLVTSYEVITVEDPQDPYEVLAVVAM